MGEGALREHMDRGPAPQPLLDAAAVLDGLGGVLAVYGEVAALTYEGAHEGPGGGLPLGHEGKVEGQRRHQHQDVQIAGVVGNDQEPRLSGEMTRGQVLQPGHHRLQPRQSEGDPRDPSEQGRSGSRSGAGRRQQQQHPAGQADRNQHHPHVTAVEPPGHRPDRPAAPLPQAPQSQPRHLNPDRRSRGIELALQVEAATGVPPDLAAGGLGDALRRNQHNLIQGDSQLSVHPLPDGCSQLLLLLRSGSTRFGHQDQALARHASSADPERGHTASPNALHIPRNMLQLLGVEISPSLDDDVLDPAGDKEFSIRQVAQVARLQPAILQDLGSGLGSSEVTLHDGGPPALDVALDPLRKGTTGTADDSDLVAGQRAAGGNKGQRVHGLTRRGLGSAGPFKSAPVDGVDKRPSAQGRDGHRQRGLGQAVDRHQGFRVQAIGLKPP